VLTMSIRDALKYVAEKFVGRKSDDVMTTAGLSSAGQINDAVNKKGVGEHLAPPMKGEKQDAFMSRCMSHMKGKGKSQEQSLGACLGMWKG